MAKVNFKFNFAHPILLLSFFAFSISCTRMNLDNKSTLSISLPSSVQNIGATATLQKSSDLQSLASTDFGVPVPAQSSSLNCFLVFVSGPESSMSSSQCTMAASANVPVGMLAGFVAAGTALSVDVTSGDNRVISLVGIQTDGTIACPNALTEFDLNKAHFSNPTIIGSVGGIKMPAGGSVSVNVPVKAAIDPGQVISVCSGPAFGPGMNGNGGGGGINLLPATNLVVKEHDPTPSGLLCSRILIEAQDSNGKIGSLTYPTRIDFPASVGGSNVDIYNDPKCQNLVLNGSPGNMTNSRTYFFIKPTVTSGSISIYPNFHDGNGGNFLSTTSVVLSAVAPPTSALSFKFYFDQSFNHRTHECIPVQLGLTDVNGSVVNLFSTLPSNSVYLTTSNLTFSSFYSDPACANAPSSLSTSSLVGESLHPLWFRSPTAGTASITAYTSSTSGACSPDSNCNAPTTYSVIASPMTTATQVKINQQAVPPTLVTFTCYPISIDLYDNNNWPAPQAAALSVSVSMSGAANCSNVGYAQLSLNNSCSGGASSITASILATENRVVVYVKQLSAAGLCNINATVNGLTTQGPGLTF